MSRPIPVRLSPRPVRALLPMLAALALAVGYRLLVAVAVAGTVVHALLFWPQSLLLVLFVLVVASGLLVVARPAVAR